MKRVKHVHNMFEHDGEFPHLKHHVHDIGHLERHVEEEQERHHKLFFEKKKRF